MKISCIFVKGELYNLYINTGNHVNTVVEKIRKETGIEPEIAVFLTKLTNEQFVKFITDNSIEQ